MRLDRIQRGHGEPRGWSCVDATASNQHCLDSAAFAVDAADAPRCAFDTRADGVSRLGDPDEADHVEEAPHAAATARHLAR